jgi:CNP1-like family
MRWLVIVFAACALAGAAGCSGNRGEAPKVKYRGDSGPNRGAPDEELWKEGEAVLPAYPRDQDLIRFEPTGQTTNRFYVDGPSLSVDPDKVIRFALVIRTAGGASTATYSGVNCKTGEWKDYAYGRDEKRWEPAKDPQWRGIRDQRINNYQYTLAVEFFCTSGVFSGSPIGSAKTIVRNLKYPPTPDHHSPVRSY